MMNIVFVFVGIALSAILIVENMVIKLPAYVFLDSGSRTYILSIVSIIIGIFIGFGIRGMFIEDKGKEDDFNY